MDYHKMILLVKLGREYGMERIKSLGLNDTEHQICSFLFFHDEVSQDTIAGALMLDKTTVAKALSNLEKYSFIIRMQNPSNRRKNVIRLSENGRKSENDSVNLHNEWLTQVMECLSKDEKKDVHAIFEKIFLNALQIRTMQTTRPEEMNYKFT